MKSLTAFKPFDVNRLWEESHRHRRPYRPHVNVKPEASQKDEKEEEERKAQE